MTYDDRFFARIREGCRRSAAAVVPRLVERFEPKRVLDVGAGEGHWGKAFAVAGCDVVGFEGSPPDSAQIDLVEVDLEQELPILEDFDLLVCLEVAEHLSPDRGPSFVRELCALAPTIIFSAAVPGQGGDGHINERWPEYWRAQFEEQGYRGSGALRWEIWDDERVSWWYRQDLLVFSKNLHGLAEDGCPGVIHPEAWRHHGHRA